MADSVEVKVGDLTVRIDRSTCAAFQNCIGIAPETFELDGEGIVALQNPEKVDRESLIEACQACPVNALHIDDENGNLIVP